MCKYTSFNTSKFELVLCCLLLVLTGCRAPANNARSAPHAETLPVAVQQRSFAAPTGPCSGSFVTRELPFVATLPGDEARSFDANGAGVAVGDLDGDGWLDLVLAHQNGPNAVLWNQGQLQFRAESLPASGSRAVNLVDVDGDDRLDIVFTQRRGGPNWWRNTGDVRERFVREVLPGVASPATVMAWADLHGDARLDLVTGSYDAELLNEGGNSFLLSSGAGVYVYTQRDRSFAAERLATKAQALAIALYDLDGDGQRDVLIGNDFAERDGAWLRQGERWVAAEPLRTTSHSTMSFDVGDIDNTGSFALFSTDMKPYNHDVGTLARWQPILATLWSAVPVGDPQIMENTLQVPDGRGGFRNQAYARGVDATGWSWSGEFGDLDNDGWLDLYVVNGMQEHEIFHYLAGHELVEQNQALRNTGERFVPQPEWGLGATAGGRGMTMADLDDDGDLDIVVNNLRGPALLFENRLCGGASLAVDLRWPASANTRALGAVVTLRTSAGRLTREVRSTAGYLSGPSPRLHFGFPASAALEALEVRWPDGAVALVDGLRAQTLVEVTRE